MSGKLFAGLVLAVLGAALSTGARACGSAGDPCQTGLGTYHVALPDDPPTGPRPVLVHFHGAGGTGAASAGNRALFRPFLDAGWVIVAPQGTAREGSEYLGWNLYVPNSGRDRDEVAFVREVFDDATARFGLDRDRAVASGFSVGGTVVWNLACRAPQLFLAFAPVGGGFWRPHPEVCAGPVRLLHTHGWSDRTVPLEGRPIRNERMQGDIFEGLQTWRRANGCDNPRPDRNEAGEAYWSRVWTACADDTALGLLLHPGGHTMPPWWANTVLDWVEGLPAPAGD